MNYSNKWTDRILLAIQKAYLEVKALIGTKEGNQKHTIGAGGDLTLEIDKRAENLIIQTLESYNEPLVFVSEEIGKFYWDPVAKQRFFKFESKICSDYVIIDPIDGSTNAKRGIPFSCISVAFADGPTLNDIQVGAVFNIGTEDLFIAEKNMGAFLNNKAIQCSQTKKLASSVGGTDIHIRDFCEPKIEEKNIILKYARKVRIMGSSALEICLVADGSLDFYIDFRGISRICDFAAAYLIVKEAGGFIINDKGRAISKSTNKFSIDKRYNLLVGCPGLKVIMKKKLFPDKYNR
ncbi:inositol monophosphatase family protein [Promethearchaeum syntrophicum]|uniref:Inositol monophosphatase family protein n=1 Tax=Promethearchaeum syntrophicum TaxID=2594042 RepID=A0A5B9DC48_9ARCH|nr:inositol monophosphatase family protein [Candidatus Prometheoarchaeum syntrophicum]QEE16692.1 Inositol-1-monophosphatase [Candidatus Prometheoarchaeum syntrophicum]